MNIEEKDSAFVWHPFTQEKTAPRPMLIDQAKGAYLYTRDGREILDAIASWWVNLHGHSHPYIVEKVHEQFKKFEQIIFAGMTHETGILLAERVLSLLPVGFKKIFYSDNGSTAVEVAIKIAIQYWSQQKQEKNRLLAFRHAYHGDTFGAMAVGERGPFTEAFSSFLFPCEFIDPPLRHQERGRSLHQLREVLDTHDDIAAFIYEPLVQGAGGMLMQDHQELDACLKLAKEKGLILIADEVMTGFGRTGKTFASEYLIQQPDLIAIAKGLTGGTMTLSMTACKDWIYDSFYDDAHQKAFFHGHSFTANALACAAAHASLDLFLDESCQLAIAEIEKSHRSFLEELESDCYREFFKDVRVQGTILACELETKTSSGYFNDVAKTLSSFFLDRDILLRPLGNTIYCIPPYCVTSNDLRRIYDAILALVPYMESKT